MTQFAMMFAIMMPCRVEWSGHPRLPGVVEQAYMNTLEKTVLLFAWGEPWSPGATVIIMSLYIFPCGAVLVRDKNGYKNPVTLASYER
jgi:hypothetical protein